MSQTFKQFIQSYDKDTIQDIADHGCASACVSDMIYYQETAALYDKHCEELHDVLDDFKDNFGEWPDYVVNNLGSVSLFKNAVVWLVAEIYAQEAVNV
jgi:hypothetical protein